MVSAYQRTYIYTLASGAGDNGDERHRDLFLSLVAETAAARLDHGVIQDVLEGEKESCSKYTLADLGGDSYAHISISIHQYQTARLRTHTLVQTSPALLLDNPLDAAVQALLRAISAGNMHPALDRDVRIGNGSGKQLAKGTEVEGIGGSNPSSPLNDVLQLLEEGVLQDGVDDQDQRWEHTREESLGTLLLKEVNQRGPSGLLLLICGAGETLLRIALARSHAGVDDPDGVGEEHGCAACECTRNHRLDGGKLLGGASGLDSSLFESRARPLVPVIVDKVGHADAEKRGFQTRVESTDTLTLYNVADRIDGRALGALGLDLSAS